MQVRLTWANNSAEYHIKQPSSWSLVNFKYKPVRKFMHSTNAQLSKAKHSTKRQVPWSSYSTEHAWILASNPHSSVSSGFTEGYNGRFFRNFQKVEKLRPEIPRYLGGYRYFLEKHILLFNTRCLFWSDLSQLLSFMTDNSCNKQKTRKWGIQGAELHPSSPILRSYFVICTNNEKCFTRPASRVMPLRLYPPFSGGLCLKGYLFQAGGVWKGRDFTSRRGRQTW